ncbi:hypothetical protein ACFL6A_00420 [bacterium]
MRRLMMGIVVFLMAFSVSAQEETVLDQDFYYSGFGAGVFSFSRVKEKGALFIGGRGGVIINQTFILGIGGYLLANNITAPPPDDDLYLNMVYFGAEVGYIHDPDRFIYFYISSLIGFGSSTLRDAEFNEMADEDFFFALEPAACLMVNVTPAFRVGLGGSYRYVSGVTEYGLSNTSLSGLSFNVMFEFGSF